MNFTFDGNISREVLENYLSRSVTAEQLYEYMIEKAKEQVPVVETGIFGADMKVSLINDGPFTILLDDAAFA